MHDAQVTAAPHPHLGIVTRDSESLRRLCLPPLGSAALPTGFFRSLPYFPQAPKGVGRLDVMATVPPHRARRSSLQPPTFSLRPSQSKSPQHNFFHFPPWAKVRQQVGHTQRISSNPRERARFVSSCAIRPRPRRVWAVHGWVRGSVASVARWPASSRGGLGCRGPGRPAPSPCSVPATPATPSSSMPAPLLAWACGRGTLRTRRCGHGRSLTRSAPAGGR